MRKSNIKNKSPSNSLYSTLYYTYYNPSSSSFNNKFNINKRKRSKDSYVEIFKEKKDCISYEIFQIKKYTEKTKSKTIISQSDRQSCPDFNKLIKNKNKDNENDMEDKLEKIEIIPYPISLRNYSRILNSEKINDFNIKNKEKKINKKKRSFFGCFKINDNIKEMLRTRNDNCDNDKKYFNSFNIIDKEKEIEKNDNSENENMCLGKISIETYTFKNKNDVSKNSIENKKDNINKNVLILENKENINNNVLSNRTQIDKRKINLEKEKNDIINYNKKKSENIKNIKNIKNI